MKIERTSSQNPAFQGLVELLDSYLAEIDGDENKFYAQFNTTATLDNCLVLYDNGVAVGCGAIREMDNQAFEIKRMFVHPTARGNGFGKAIVKALEDWARELGVTRCLLETGKRMPDAVALYKKLGYTQIENYEPYVGVENSVCFEKPIC
ncbi:GNAT family N-acetyltransferase [Dokdonia sinensis]|uniref:GNAT family N-acetyltransferase n=1 Tax=Dokdonia sinensis TaxID=2479847 RepID=A0A3M0G0E1_9FLAO|nr:GNAT family N-acetyltransferase [Dokdonia sinensis]RMB57647.1 GNAT family N-acetyltransferase [Dokdonia sinensis]